MDSHVPLLTARDTAGDLPVPLNLSLEPEDTPQTSSFPLTQQTGAAIHDFLNDHLYHVLGPDVSKVYFFQGKMALFLCP